MKRKLDNLARWKKNLFEQIATLREVATTHDMMSVAWNFVEDNKADLIECCGQDPDVAHLFATQSAAPEAISSTETDGILQTHERSQTSSCAPAQMAHAVEPTSPPLPAGTDAQEHCAADIIHGASNVRPPIHPPQPGTPKPPAAAFSASETRGLSPANIPAPQPSERLVANNTITPVPVPQPELVTETPRDHLVVNSPATPVAQPPHVGSIAPASATGKKSSLADVIKRDAGPDKKNKRKQEPDSDSGSGDEDDGQRVHHNKKKRHSRSKGKPSRSKKDVSDHSEDDESTDDSESELVSSKKESRKRKRGSRKSKKSRKRASTCLPVTGLSYLTYNFREKRYRL